MRIATGLPRPFPDKGEDRAAGGNGFSRQIAQFHHRAKKRVDFHRAAEAIDIGMQAANRALDPIEQAITALT